MAKAKNNAAAKPKYKYELRQGRELDIYEDLPKGWKVDRGAMTAPVGTVTITNGGSLFGKNGTPRRQSALLITNKEWFEEDTLKSVKKIKRLTKSSKAKNTTNQSSAEKAKAADKCKYQTVMTGSDGKKLPPVICRDKADAEDMKRNIESLGYKVEIQPVKFSKAKPTAANKPKRKTKADKKPTAEELGAELEAKTKSLKACLHKIKSKSTATNKPEKAKSTAQSKAATPAVKPTAAKSTASTFTVMAGRKSKTFATKAEAQAYGKQCKKKTGKKYVIRESKKKPSHKVVSFTAKSK